MITTRAGMRDGVAEKTRAIDRHTDHVFSLLCLNQYVCLNEQINRSHPWRGQLEE